MIQWWTDLIMFSHAGLDAASRAPFGARAEHAGCLSYLASHLLNGYFPLDEATRRLGGCWAMTRAEVGPFTIQDKDRASTGTVGLAHCIWIELTFTILVSPRDRGCSGKRSAFVSAQSLGGAETDQNGSLQHLKIKGYCAREWLVG